MKVTGFVIALAAAAPIASAIPFKLSDILPRHENVQAESFPQLRTTNLTARGTNETVVDKRAFLPQGNDDKSKRSFANGIEFVEKRTNLTFKA